MSRVASHYMTEQKNGRSKSRDGHDAHHGQVLVIFAISLVALLGFAALSIDVGYYLAERRSLQNATDSAAMAAARLVLRNDTTDLTFQAESFIASNGYPEAEVEVTPGEDEVRVTVEHTVEQFFSGMFIDGEAWSVTTEAVARTAPEEVPFAIIALGEDPNCSNLPGIRFSGGVAVNTQGGGIGTNACVWVDGMAGTGSIDGHVEAHGSIDPRIANFSPTGLMSEDQGIIPDPYLEFVDESPHPSNSEDCETVDPEIEVDPPTGGSRTWTMQPGRYTSASNLSPGGNVDNVILESGVYCFETQFVVNSNNTDIDASSGVLMYLASPNGNFEPGNANYEITSLGDEWSDIVIWSDNCGATLDMHGNGQMTVRGVIYAPCSPLELGGTSGTDVLEGQVVAHDIWFHGNVEFNIDAGLEHTADPLRVFLVE